MCQRASLL